ncbi:MAG: zinc metalloprotease HtpX [Clostridia bacterium]
MATRRWYGRDAGLSVRMGLVMFLLAVIYLAFIAVLLLLRVPIGFLIVIIGGMLVAQFYFSDRMVLAATGARLVTRQQAPELHQIIDRLCQLSDIPRPQVAVMNTDMPNAFATGRNPQHAVVTVTRGLMRGLEPDELEAVLGHELSHVKNRDVAVMTIASFFATVASILVQQFLWFGMWGGMGARRRGGNGNAAILIWFVALLVWALSYLLIRALSRYRELAADRGSAIITGQPSKLASALVKISQDVSRIPDRDLRQTDAAAAFFIIPALRRDSLAALISTHPPLKVRLAQLERLSREMEH